MNRSLMTSMMLLGATAGVNAPSSPVVLEVLPGGNDVLPSVSRSAHVGDVRCFADGRTARHPIRQLLSLRARSRERDGSSDVAAVRAARGQRHRVDALGTVPDQR